MGPSTSSWVQEGHLGRTPQTSQRHRHYSSTKTRNLLHCLPEIIYQLTPWISRVFFCLKMKPSEIPFLMALFWCLCLCQVCFKLCAKFLVGLSPFPASHLFRKEYQVTALANKKQKVWGQNHSSHSESQSSPQLISVLTCFNSSKYHCFISLHAHQASLTFRCSGNSMLSGKEGCELRSACGFSSLRAAQHTQKTTLVRSQPGLHKVYKCYGPRDQDCPRFWGGCSVTSCLTCAWWNIRLSMGMKRRKAGLCP